MMKKGIFVITIVISIALIIGGFYSYNSRINNLSKTNKGKEDVKNSIIFKLKIYFVKITWQIASPS